MLKLSQNQSTPSRLAKIEKHVDYFSQSVYTMIRSKCLPLADGAGYK